MQATPAPRPTSQVVGIGCAALDYLAIVPHMPQFDDPESIKPAEWRISGGGPVATALVALARLRVPVAYVGQLGDDMVGCAIQDELVAEGVDISRVRNQVGLRSVTSLVLVEAGTGRRAFICLQDKARGFDLTASDRQLIQEARILHLDGWYSETALVGARIAREAGTLVSLDAYNVDEGTDEWVSATDIVVANETFPRRYTGHDNLEKAAGAVLEQGPRLFAATLGDRGCFVATRAECFYVPAFQVDVVDTTGAGDAFHGAFLYGLVQSWSLRGTARFACAAAALACRRLGGRASIPTLGELQDFLGQEGEHTA